MQRTFSLPLLCCFAALFVMIFFPFFCMPRLFPALLFLICSDFGFDDALTEVAEGVAVHRA